MSALPSGWAWVPVSGTYANLDGTPAVGAVEFSAAQALVVDHVTVFPARFVVDLDETGHFATELPATNDPALSNRDWTYHVRELMPGGRTFDITLPFDSAAIDLASVAPAVPPERAESLATVARTGDAADLTGLQAVVDAAVAASPASGLTNAQADARYVRLSQIDDARGVAGDVLTKRSNMAGDNGWAPATIQWASTNW